MPSLPRAAPVYSASWEAPALFRSWCGLCIAIYWLCSMTADAMTRSQIAGLRQDAVDMFYHGFDNYMTYAFPEDELRPVSCTPLTRDPEHPENIGLNDVLGNYSLTLIDSLSTLAILASSKSEFNGKAAAAEEFQEGVQLLVEYYGDGTAGSGGRGQRATGFDLDSKVQVFETVIRGVGGLLSAHLYAVGALPGLDLGSDSDRKTNNRQSRSGSKSVWRNGFLYDGQLLRLAHDLASRVLPAFHTVTGIPYPRVNLRHGIPFYLNSPLFHNAEYGVCKNAPHPAVEITETCSAGAGSLVLEFATLSRLTGDARFESVAKRAFWEVWKRRSSIGLIAAGLDAESGLWTGATTGIGAGVDSFFEYALKSHILLSRSDAGQASQQPANYSIGLGTDPNQTLRSLTAEERSSEAFLSTWHDAHHSIKRHLYRDTHHPHYVNAHFMTGAPHALWVDSLGAYYPGLLTLGGELEEAIETNLLYTALWTRYAALPERWSTKYGDVEGGLGWWPGRPEFIESNYHLYRATKDPWYLYVGEMVLRDIQKRCWVKCGLAGIQDVRSGELTDRMESFFLGETAKYLFLLFDDSHPLNTLDAPFVFTTEGHPLLLPATHTGPAGNRRRRRTRRPSQRPADVPSFRRDFCPKPPTSAPFSMSATAERGDLFHAASLSKLHVAESFTLNPAAGWPQHDLQQHKSRLQMNHSLYPWTLPESLLPLHGISSGLPGKHTFDIQFPSSAPNLMIGQQSLTRISEGLLVGSLDGMRLSLVVDEGAGGGDGAKAQRVLRIHAIGSIALGRDEKVLIKRDTLGHMVDPIFTRIRDPAAIDLVLELKGGAPDEQPETRMPKPTTSITNATVPSDILTDQDLPLPSASVMDVHALIGVLLQQLPEAVQNLGKVQTVPDYKGRYIRLSASTATGIGAVPPPDVDEVPDPDEAGPAPDRLPWRTIFLGDGNCDKRLSVQTAAEHTIIVLRRGRCSFSQKLANIPSYPPDRKALQMVVVVSDDVDVDDDGGGGGGANIRPLLDREQRTPSGLPRHHPIPLVLVGGGEQTWQSLKDAQGIGLRRRYQVQSQGMLIANLIVF
ncbi:MAG: alpha mannosidase-like protein [Caeruleum heppii]|nr:MAG: alpha mannosidase-like protein [Caeruleum heppii]